MASLRQPRAFYVLFFVELWERFGYYGVQALLVLYLTKFFKLPDDFAYSIFAAFSSLIYTTPILGGFIADRYIGYQRALWLGGVLLFMGYLILGLPPQTLPLGDAGTIALALGFVITGNGFFKPAPSSLLGKCYPENDPRMDSAFTLFYMSINIGSFLSITLSGFVAETLGWSAAYLMCAGGMLLGILTFFATRFTLKGIGTPADKTMLPLRIWAGTLFTISALVLCATWLMSHIKLTQEIQIGAGIGVIGFFTYLLKKLEGEQRRRMLACLLLIVFAIIFFALYFQAPMSLTLFTERNVDKTLFGFAIPTASFYALNPLWIIFLAPIVAWLYDALNQHGKSVSIPSRFALGTLIMGTGFLLLYLCRWFADSNAMVSAWWIVGSYGLQSTGEVLVSALGLSMIARLAPPQYLGLMMGTWFLGTAAAAAIAGPLAHLSLIPSESLGNNLQTLTIYTRVFGEFGLFCTVLSLLAFCVVPYISRLAR